MPKLLFVTVGTTALVSPDIRVPLEDERDYFNDLRKRYQDIKADRVQIEAEVSELLLKAHRAFWEEKNTAITAYPERTSAEMTSTYLITCVGGENMLGLFNPKTDKIVLLASDTDEGRLCARVNAQLMHEFIFSPACDCGADVARRQVCERAVVEEVKGLEANTFSANVTDSVFEILGKYDNGKWTIACNITAGFKGTIPAITCWARNRPVALFYQHVSNKGAVRLDFVPGMAVPQERSYLLSLPPRPSEVG